MNIVYSILISIPISCILYFFLVLFYLVTRNLDISIKNLSTENEFSSISQAYTCLSNCKQTSIVSTLTIEWVSIIPIFIGILDFIGWIFIFIFGGIGLFSFPFQMIFKIFNRKKRLSTENYKTKREEMMNKTLKLMETGKDLKTKIEKGELDFTSFKNNKELIQFTFQVEKNEKKWKKIDEEFKKKGESVLFDLFCLFYGFFSLIFSSLIIMQIATNKLNPPSKIIGLKISNF